MNQKLLALFGLKYDLFSPEIPTEALYLSPKIQNSAGASSRRTCARGDGLSYMATLAPERVSSCGCSPSASHAWPASTSASCTTRRSVLLCDDAQEMNSLVLNELRLLSSARFDSQSLLCIVLAGDAHLLEKLRSEELVPLGSRIKTRLATEAATREELLACLEHLLAAAGNASLMTRELRQTLVDHAAGNLPHPRLHGRRAPDDRCTAGRSPHSTRSFTCRSSPPRSATPLGRPRRPDNLAHERERERLYQERFLVEAQQPLPFPDRRSDPHSDTPSPRSLTSPVHHRS